MSTGFEKLFEKADRVVENYLGNTMTDEAQMSVYNTAFRILDNLRSVGESKEALDLEMQIVLQSSRFAQTIRMIEIEHGPIENVNDVFKAVVAALHESYDAQFYAELRAQVKINQYEKLISTAWPDYIKKVEYELKQEEIISDGYVKYYDHVLLRDDVLIYAVIQGEYMEGYHILECFKDLEKAEQYAKKMRIEYDIDENDECSDFIGVRYTKLVG